MRPPGFARQHQQYQQWWLVICTCCFLVFAPLAQPQTTNSSTQCPADTPDTIFQLYRGIDNVTVNNVLNVSDAPFDREGVTNQPNNTLTAFRASIQVLVNSFNITQNRFENIPAIIRNFFSDGGCFEGVLRGCWVFSPVSACFSQSSTSHTITIIITITQADRIITPLPPPPTATNTASPIAYPPGNVTALGVVHYYTTTIGKMSQAELVARASIQTLLGLFLNQAMPLNFTQTVVFTPGNVSFIRTVCSMYRGLCMVFCVHGVLCTCLVVVMRCCAIVITAVQHAFHTKNNNTMWYSPPLPTGH